MADLTTIGNPSVVAISLTPFAGATTFSAEATFDVIAMGIGPFLSRFRMGAKHATLTYVTWVVERIPDYTGAQSTYVISDLSNIAVISKF